MAVERSSFVERRLKVGETIEAVKVTFSKASVHTSERLLSFEAQGAEWKEHRLD